MPPSLALIFRQRLDRVWGDVFTTFFTWTHWVAMPSRVSPTRFTSAVGGGGHITLFKKQDQQKVCFHNARSFLPFTGVERICI